MRIYHHTLIAVCFTLSAYAGSATADEQSPAIDRCSPVSVEIDPSSPITSAQAAAVRVSGSARDLLMALGNDRREKLRGLLERGANPNVCVLGMSLLGLSVTTGDIEEVSLLLNAGANVDSPRDADGGTPLLHAIESQQLTVARLLLERGANPAYTTDGGTSALHALTILSLSIDSTKRALRLELLRALLQANGHVDGRAGANQSTPLMLAALSGDADVVRLLLAFGANPAIRNARGLTASDFARRKNLVEIANLIDAQAAKAGRETDASLRH